MDFKHSKRLQWASLFVFFAICFGVLFYLEGKMEHYEKELKFGYRDFYQKPFHYMLDPFTYVGLKDGVPIVELQPPNPHFVYSYEELLVTRFIDYFIWARNGGDEVDTTFYPERFDQTVDSFAGYIRHRLYYRLDRNQLFMNPIILTDPKIPPGTDLKQVEAQEPNKLVWNVVPYCNDPVLEESLHELGNVHGFLYVRGNHGNYRYTNEKEEKGIAQIFGNVNVKMVSHFYLISKTHFENQSV